MHNVATGELNVSVSVDGEDEIGQLSKDLSTMVKSINDLIHEVYEVNLQKNNMLIMQKEIRYKMLSSQVNPHFLFNALEAIRMRSHSKGDDEFDLNQQTLKAYYLSIYISIINSLSLKYENAEDIVLEQKSVCKNIQYITNIDEVERFFQDQVLRLSNILLEKKSTHVMNNILAYIHKNLEKDIKLENLAKVFNYNTTYLGKMFKDYTGEYFNTYLDRVRMEKAKLLLKEGYKVHTVAEKIGYSNMTYFYSKFKKYIGLPPRSIKNSSS